MTMPPSWPLGVMQGRLLPKYQGHYQAHPKGYWADEFRIAASYDLDLIEFILNYNDAEENPLLSPTGIDEISQVVAETGVNVHSICADYFMEAPLHAEDADTVNTSCAVLAQLIESAPTLGVTDIVIPCVDQSSLESDAAENRLLVSLDALLPLAEEHHVNLALETDLAPDHFARFLEKVGNSRLTVNYDTGNSASLGYDPVEEWAAYGNHITDVHIKDRTRDGGSIVLGKGDADIPAVLGLMRKHQFDGRVIMEAYRDDEGLAVFSQQLDLLCGWISEVPIQ